jgi:TetR/AcrR family transcriptional repressor of bet genes
MTRTTKPEPRFRRVAPAERRALLIEAGLACLARGGILGFTIDNICAEAEVSRGLITHHFQSKDGLLAAIYDTMIERLLSVVDAPPEGHQHISAIIDASFAPDAKTRDSLRIWLALWGEIANNPALLKAHRRQYARYRRGVETALTALARERGREVDIPFVALMFISLVDGLWLEWSIDPKQISAGEAKAACQKLLEPFFGAVS